MRLLLLTIFIMTFATPALAEKNSTTTTTQNSSSQGNIQNSISKNSDNGLYKLLYENSATSNTRIISTIQWSIGIISTFVIVLLGSQILFNYRVNKEEIRAIKSELEEKFSEFKAELISNSNQERKELIEKFESKFSNNEINTRKNISEHYEEKDKYLDVKLESFHKDITRIKGELNSKIKKLSMRIHKIDAEVWKIKGVNANALKEFISLLELNIDKGSDLNFELDDILETLQKMDSINKDVITNLINTMERVPKEYQVKTLKIKELYSTLPQYMFIDDPKRPGYLKSVNI